MPASASARYLVSTHVRRQDDASASEAASLAGQPAKTPIIAGSICGGVLFIAWVIGFAIYFRKRQKRKERKRAAEEGLCDPPPEKGIIPVRSESDRVVIPPDPAVLLGYAKPGEIAHPAASRQNSGGVSGGEQQQQRHSGKRREHGRHGSSSSAYAAHSRGHSRSGSTQSGKKRSRSMEQIPTPSRPLPLKSHSHHHKKSHSSSSNSNMRPSSPKRGQTDDSETVPLNLNDAP